MMWCVLCVNIYLWVLGCEVVLIMVIFVSVCVSWVRMELILLVVLVISSMLFFVGLVVWICS